MSYPRRRRSFARILSRARRALAAVSCLLALAATAAPLRAQSLDRIERERAQTMLSVIRDELKKHYYDPGFGGLDVEARFKQSEEKLKQATSLGQAYGIIAQTLLDLNDSHTTFDPPSRSVSVEYGWEMQMVGDKAYVVAVRPGSDAEKKGLKPGDLVVAVENFRPTRKDLWKMYYYYYRLSPRPGLRVVVQSPGGEPRQLDVAAKVTQHKRMLNLTGDTLGSDGDINTFIRDSEDAYRLQRHRFQKLPGAVVWQMPSFSFEPAQADSIMNDQIKQHPALILDLRGNPGGYIATLERLSSNFFDREVKIADLKGRKEMKPVVAKKGGNRFEGKLVVLIDSESGSCAELFARVVQLEKRGVVIGDRSAGAVMQSRYYSKELGHDSLVFYGASITNADMIMGDGRSLERVGVTPDELVVPTAEDLAAGRDPVLARAAALLGIKLDPAVAGQMFPVEWNK